MTVGGVVAVTVNVTVDPDVTDGSTLSNTATVSTTTTDPDSANDSDTATTDVNANADISITKTDSADPVVAGETITYTLIVSNAGSSDALAVVVTDVLAGELAFFSATTTQGSCTESGGTVTCSLGTVVADGSVTITLVVDVAPSASGSLSNTATVTSTTSDPDGSNNSDAEATALSNEADLWIIKSSTPVPFVAGDPITYTITVGNDGPSDVVGATVTDVFPVDILSPTWTCTSSGGAACATSGSGDINENVNLPVGSSVVFIVTATVDPGTSSASISNTATVAVPASTTDPDPADNSDTDANPFSTDADLSISKTASPDPVLAGETLVYTIVVSNAGPGTATDVAVADTLPAGVAFISAAVSGGSGTESCGEAGGVVSCAHGTIDPGDAETITLTVAVDPSAGGSIVNSATVLGSTTDPDGSNNDDSASVSVNAEVDLSLSKTASPPAVDPGDAITYTIIVTSGGPSVATGVVVADPIPAGVTFDSASSTQGPCSIGAVLSCSIGTMIPGSSVTITVIATAVSAGTVVNTATVSTSTPDTNSSNDSDSAAITISGAGSIRSVVWWDLDGNGTVGISEPALVDVTVNLYDDGGLLIDSTGTDASGEYRFDNVTPGDFEVRVDATSIPNGAEIVTDPQGSVDGIATLTVVADAETTDLDFGYGGTSTVRGTVFHDVDEDDVQDLPFEPGIPFVDVTVTWAGPDGTIGTSDDVDFDISTNGFGAYEAASLPAGAYRIVVDEASLPFGLEVTTLDHPATRNVGAGGAAVADFGVAGNTAPNAVNDEASTPQEIPVTITVLGNDTDPEGDPIAVSVIGPAGNGTVVVAADGSVIYTPDDSFTGVDSFVYTITDTEGETDTAVVTVTVIGDNRPPDYVPVDPGDPLPDPPTADPDDDDVTIEIIDGSLPDGVELIDGQLVGTPTGRGHLHSHIPCVRRRIAAPMLRIDRDLRDRRPAIHRSQQPNPPRLGR